jgi:tetratricopeptide (TPR) repeat protein
MEIEAARKRVLEHERYRPGSGHLSAFWERQQWWQQAFDELVEAENARDRRFRNTIDALPLGADTAPKQLKIWADEVNKRIAWYADMIKRLRTNQRSWGTDPQGQPLAPLARVGSRHAACVSLAALINVELLEYQRRLKGRLNERAWQQAHADLEQAFSNQATVWRTMYKADLPSGIGHQRIVACQHVRTMQAATLGQWHGQSKVDREGLVRHTKALDGTLEALRRPTPAPQSGGVGLGLLVIAVIGVAILLAYNNRDTGSMPEPAVIAAPVRVTPGVSTGAVPTVSTGVSLAAQALDDQGIAMLKAGRCDQAIDLFGQAAAADPDWYQPLSDMAFCMYERGEAYAAIASWEDALRLTETSADANAGLGMALYATGQRDQGLEKYRRAIKQDARYRDEGWMRRERQWSEKAIADSRPLREQLGQ